jgi:hypothetical protein
MPYSSLYRAESFLHARDGMTLRMRSRPARVARITQEEIAEQMDVSRSAMLQALRVLKKDGLVKDAPVVEAFLSLPWIQIGSGISTRFEVRSIIWLPASLQKKCDIGLG